MINYRRMPPYIVGASLRHETYGADLYNLLIMWKNIVIDIVKN